MANILVVDDDRISRKLLATNLTKAGHAVQLAQNGEEALEMLGRNKYDVLLLDLVMPRLDGFAVLAHMRQEKEWQHIPVVVISQADDIENMARCIEMGATDYLTKPFNPILLHARIKASLANSHLRAIEQKYIAELEAQNAELDAFAYTVAHDLKNPISVSFGMAEVFAHMYGPKLDEGGRRLIEKIASSQMKMSNIVNALLMLARVRHEPPRSDLLLMEHILLNVKERLELLYTEYKAELVLPDKWPIAYGYAPWIEEVWVNYISNAFKYGGSNPQVVLGATALPTGYVRFWVRDNGPGIPPDKQDQIFTPFTRLAQKQVEGHGLGLSIVERIIRKLGGDVGVDSQLNEGCTFWFSLPAAVSA